MDRSERFYRIDRLLRERRLVSFDALQEELGISRATLKRDLQYLRDRLNAPILFDRERGGYHLGEPPGDTPTPRYELPGLWFSPGEAHALLTLQHLLENLEPGLLGPLVGPLQSRLEALLTQGSAQPERLRARIRIIPGARRPPRLACFQPVATALLQGQRLHLRHHHRGRNQVSEREVSPQRLIWYRDHWYLDAWCHLREALRSFAIDSLLAATPLDQPALELPAETLDSALGAGYGIFAGTELQWATLRFSAERARWVADEIWHPHQRSHREADGRYVLEVPYAQETELLMDILRHMPEVEVLSPPTLRQQTAKILAAALAQHDATPPGEA